MKKLAVIGEGIIYEAIVKYFDGKDVEITSLLNLADKDIVEKFDLIALINYDNNIEKEILKANKFINIHPSLLPAFEGKDANQKAFTSGVKVSGVTVHWVTNEQCNGKIIAQYPVLIGNTTHFDEFEQEIHRTANLLYPRVIECILDDKVFDFADLLKGGCQSGGCGGCGGCH